MCASLVPTVNRGNKQNPPVQRRLEPARTRTQTTTSHAVISDTPVDIRQADNHVNTTVAVNNQNRSTVVSDSQCWVVTCYKCNAVTVTSYFLSNL